MGAGMGVGMGRQVNVYPIVFTPTTPPLISDWWVQGPSRGLCFLDVNENNNIH